MPAAHKNAFSLLHRFMLVACIAQLLISALLSDAHAAEEESGPVLLPPPSLLLKKPSHTLEEAVLPEPSRLGSADDGGKIGEPELDDQPIHPLVEGAPTAPAAESLVAPDAKLAETTVVIPPRWYEPAYWFGPTPWDAGLQFGLNGSQGNNDVLSMRVGGHLNRENALWKLVTSLGYNKNVANSVETQNNAKFDLRLDRNVDGTRWTLFFLENLIYDEFQSFDLQLSLNVGLGYRFFKTPELDLLGRFGAGATREVGGPDNEWVQQALFGLDYTHQITKMQKLTAKVDMFPEWADFSNYRIVADFGWQIDLDQPKNVSLKASIIDRYDSTPNGSRPNNFDYAVLLIWGL